MNWYKELMEEFEKDKFSDNDKAKFHIDELTKLLNELDEEKVDVYKYLDSKGYNIDEIFAIVSGLNKSIATQKEINEYIKYKK